MTNRIAADAAGIARAAQVLRAGGVIAFATDTVWGIGALASCPPALARIFAIKGRADTRPVACLVRDAAMARALSDRWDAQVEAIARRHWPGALTIVVPAAGRFPAAQRGLATLGLRVPDRPAVLALLDDLREPLAATSANLSGQPELPDAGAVHAALGAHVDLVLDDASPVSGLASTVVEWNTTAWRVLRPGAVQLDSED